MLKPACVLQRYTEALTLCPDWAVLLVNRAQCHRKQGEWRQQESDCRRALKIDGKSMKVRTFLELGASAISIRGSFAADDPAARRPPQPEAQSKTNSELISWCCVYTGPLFSGHCTL